MQNIFKSGFLQTLVCLRDYLSVVVVGGGWAPLIYYHYLLKDKTIHPIMTKDIDFMVTHRVPVIGDRTIDEILQDAGLTPVFKSMDNPPVMHYEGNIKDDDVEIEFLTDLTGSDDSLVIKVQNGLNAEALRYISLITENTLDVEIDDLPPDSPHESLKVKVPQPGAYIFQKGLIFKRRKTKEKKAKDLYYIFDIFVNCREIEEQIFNEMKNLTGAHTAWFEKMITNMETYFPEVISDGVYMLLNQRPADALPDLTDDQFKQYAHGIFQKFIKRIKTF